jgi:SNF2-related domain
MARAGLSRAVSTGRTCMPAGRAAHVPPFECSLQQRESALQGLGKTVTTIALLVCNKAEPDRSWRRVQVDLDGKARKRKRAQTPLASASADGKAAANAPVDIASAEAGALLDRGPKAADEKAPAGAADSDSLPITGDAAAAAAAAGPVKAGKGAGKANGALSGLPQAGTLIVAPTSLLTQWESEVNSKVCWQISPPDHYCSNKHHCISLLLCSQCPAVCHAPVSVALEYGLRTLACTCR